MTGEPRHPQADDLDTAAVAALLDTSEAYVRALVRQSKFGAEGEGWFKGRGGLIYIRKSAAEKERVRRQERRARREAATA